MQDFHSNGHDSDRPESLRDMLRTHITEQRDFNKKVERLHTIVLGDKDANQLGLVDKVEDHRKYISNDKKIKWIGVGLAGSTGFGLGFMDQLKHFIFK